LQDFIVQFGYFAVFVGTFLEGETVLALAGLAAAYGYLSFPGVIAVAVVGAFLGDQTAFFIDRRFGVRIIARYPTIAAKAPRVQALVRRWDGVSVILLRFCYGLRIAGPIVIGSCRISPWRLAFFNFIGTLIWAPLVAGLGYVAGEALEMWLGRLKHVQVAVLMAVALVALIGGVTVMLRRRSR